MKTNNKRGVSLIVLIVTIVVMLILLGITIVNTDNTVENADKVTFINDLKIIQDSAEAYYIVNKELPTDIDIESYTKDTLIAVQSKEDLRSTLDAEIILNGDEEATFYKINLDKLNVETTRYGTMINGEADILVVAMPSLNVYYVQGVKLGDEYYFSLSSNLINQLDTGADKDNSSTSATIISGINYTKNEGYTNKMGLNITTDLKANESLYIGICSTEILNKISVGSAGYKEIKFDTLSELAQKYGVYAWTNQLSDLEGRNPIENRYIYIEKRDASNKVIAKTTIDLSNYCKSAPSIATQSISRYTDFNVMTVEFDIAGCDIKEVKYITSINQSIEDVLEFGMVASPVDNKVSVQLDKTSTNLTIVAVDYAGNTVMKEITNIY